MSDQMGFTRMLHRIVAPALALGLLATPALAQTIDPTRDYGPDEAPIPSTWYASPDTVAADRAYIAGMRPHHAGAVTMSEEYLADREARSPVLRRLAQAFIANQRYEIALLDEVARLLDQPARSLDIGLFRLEFQPVATEGLGPIRHFQKAPIPGPAALLAAPPPSTRDVQFAKGMTIHHQAALDMVRDYRADPRAANGFLHWLNLGIETDQSQEIALMRAVIARFPGDADSIRVDPAMIHGMQGHAGHAAPAAAAPATAEPAPARRPAVRHRAARQAPIAPPAQHQHH